MKRKERVRSIEETKLWKYSTIHITQGERRKARQDLGSRSARRRGIKCHSLRNLAIKKLSPAPRIKLGALLDKLKVKKIREALGENFLKDHPTMMVRS